MKGKLIVIEGTDCSGKETQSKKIIERFNKEGIKMSYFSFPQYDSPTGKIIAGPYLGKKNVCAGWFSEKAPLVDPKVASLYYAADRKYNINKVLTLLEKGENVILDRYFYSNMAHQGGKIKNKEERYKMYKWILDLEVSLLELPIPDIKIFLYVPNQVSKILKDNRSKNESLDENESDNEYLKLAENSYKEIASYCDFKTIECTKNNKILKIEEINDMIYNYLKEKIN